MSSVVDITVVLNGGNKIFRCNTDKDVEWAKDEIRSKYCLQGGGITLDGVVQDSRVTFKDMKDGELQFVDGERSGKYPAVTPVIYISHLISPTRFLLSVQ